MIDIISIIGSWLICAVAAERAAEAITTSVFFAPLRHFLARTALSSGHILIKEPSKWLSDLVSCGWCTSFWTSLLCALTLPGSYNLVNVGDNIIIKAVALWGFANLWHSVFRLIHNGRVAAIDLNVRVGDRATDGSVEIGGSDGEFGKSGSTEDAGGDEPPAI